jgi:hypothetical protein
MRPSSGSLGKRPQRVLGWKMEKGPMHGIVSKKSKTPETTVVSRGFYACQLVKPKN